MNLKILLLVTVVVEVKSDCDDYLKCLGEFIQDFFGADLNSTEINVVKSDKNNTFNTTDQDFNDTIEDLYPTPENFNYTFDNITGAEKNVSLSLFDISYLQKSFEDAWSEVSSAIKEELEGILNIETESDTFKTKFNETEINLKTFELGDLVRTSDIKKDAVNIETGSDLLIPFDFDGILKSALEKENDSKNVVSIKPELIITNVTFVESIPVFSRNNTDEATKINIYPDIFKQFNNKTEIVVQPFFFEEQPTGNLQSNVDTKNNLNNETEVFISNVSIVNIPTIIQDIQVKKPEIISPLNHQKDILVKTFESVIPVTNLLIKPNIIELNGSTNEAVNIPSTVLNNLKPVNDIKQKEEAETTSNASTPKNVNYKQVNLAEDVKQNEISNKDDELYYDIDDNATDYPIIDYIELYKDTTNEFVDYKATDIPITASETASDLDNVIEYSVLQEDALRNGYNADYMEPSCNGSNVATTTFPWLATIFIKNGSSNQFDYFCDGALLSHNTILTAARCVNGTDTFASESILVIVGKRSLQVPRNDESVHRVKQVLVHEKFADVNETGNDVAILVLEDPVVFSSSKRIACMQSAEIGVGDAFTTGWGYSGNLTAIRFDKKKSESCQGSGVANTFCATYANGVTVCPSFGGIYAAQQGDQWVLRGLRTGDPMNRGFCIDKTVVYTNLDDYNDWIVGNIEKN